MQKHELLVPVGNMECLKQAVYNGCNAVYLAGKNFGARKYATNFTNEEIVEAIQFCHLYDVLIYITMNTLVKENEIESFINQVRFLHQNGVDAIIVQDFGMICLLRKMFPNLEIHASTQTNISSKDVCKLYSELGVKRVVFARELSLKEIESIDVDIEKEAFIHGALCISYSGGCLMSSMLGGRSGNRGECAGVCRMPFSLWHKKDQLIDNKYLLSTKELNTSNYFDHLLNSNIYSFKIEGRMKGPLYVGFITSFYRKLLDGEKISIKEFEDKLKTIYNREFTKGRLFNETDEDLMNIKSPNHQGLLIGKTTKINNKKIKIELNPGCNLHQYDAIRFYNNKNGFIINYLYDEKSKLTNSISKIGYVDNKIDLKENDMVYKTHDYLLEKYYSQINQKKIKVSFKVKAKLNKKLVITISDNNKIIEEFGNIIMPAEKSPITKSDIIKHINHLNDTPFYLDNIDIEMDSNIFIPVKELKTLRRKLVDKLIYARKNHIKNKFIEEKVLLKRNSSNQSTPKISCSIYNQEQLDACLKLGISRIYIRNKELYENNKNNKSIFYYAPRNYFNLADIYQKQTLVSDYANYHNHTVIGNYTLNVTNSYTAYFLKTIGCQSICLSPELSKEEILLLINNYQKLFGDFSFEILKYGRIENMHIKGNILNLKSNDFTYYLSDSKSRKFPVYYDNTNTHIMNYEVKKGDLEICNNSITSRLDFYEETKEDIISIVKKYQ